MVGHANYRTAKVLDYFSTTERTRVPNPFEQTDLYPLLMLGELVQTTAGKWITHLTIPMPQRSPPRTRIEVLVGHVACLGHGGGGHTSWHCRTCDDVVYGPPMNTHCSALKGPATVRLSTQRNSAT